MLPDEVAAAPSYWPAGATPGLLNACGTPVRRHNEEHTHITHWHWQPPPRRRLCQLRATWQLGRQSSSEPLHARSFHAVVGVSSLLPMLPHGDDSTIDVNDNSAPSVSATTAPTSTTSPSRDTTNTCAPTDTSTCTPSPTAVADDTGAPRNMADAALVYAGTAASTHELPTVCRDSVMRNMSGVDAPVKYAAVSESMNAKAWTTSLQPNMTRT